MKMLKLFEFYNSSIILKKTQIEHIFVILRDKD